VRRLVNGQAIEQPAQLPDREQPRLGGVVRPAKPVPLQPLVPQTETVAVPVEDFDCVFHDIRPRIPRDPGHLFQ